MNVNWNLYKVFYYVAHSGSTALASRKLFIAQPSVSHAIKQLEQHLKYDLFERSYRGMELTEHGRILYEHISTAMSSIEEAEAYFEQMQVNDTNVVNIAVIDTTMQFFVMPIMGQIEAEYPGIQMNLINCHDISDAEELIYNGDADFAVMCTPSQQEDMENFAVKEVQDILVCDAKYYERLKTTSLDIKELKNFQVVTHRKGTASRVCIDSFLAKNAVELHPIYEYSQGSSILRQLAQEFCLGFILEETVRHRLENKSLVKIDLDPPVPSRWYYLVRPKKINSRASAAVAAYILAHVNKV